ncbi:NAD(P)/FAD-dependent oxidoreductase [Clostridium guangxiense]|uniref:NAD(P)/FAD-dependent oxidoreductase n=1 Tax=Clostridium guangxiense TaxID=1662055 RepID=UPI001E4C5E55|nr:NAD(P)/FAD-dependent oxidoreductase [Clostridium guangxiense]MCD2347308.1 NAD(P)/FAD-dependent oxidoreductase [Clostridium guangxiense]
MTRYDLVIIGGGAAGLMSAISASEAAVKNILIIEREDRLGGILNQCIHNGFGDERTTGPEYANKLKNRIIDMKIEYKVNTTVIDMDNRMNITAVNESDGVLEIKAKAVIFAVGFREKTKSNIFFHRTHCSGIFSALTAQKFINIEGYMPGNNAVILGSEDIALILARRMTIEGAEVKAVIERGDRCVGNKKNEKECLRDFNIPLLTKNTVTKIKSNGRIEGVYVAQLDENNEVIKDSAKFMKCDALILALGFSPENELMIKANVSLSKISGSPYVDMNLETSVSGIFACGNVIHQHDYVESIADEAYKAGINAANFIFKNISE